MKYNLLAGGAFLTLGLMMVVFAGAQHATANGIVISEVLALNRNSDGSWGAITGQRGAELVVNLPVHDAPANTYDKASVPFSYRIKWAVCENRTAYSRVIARYDLAGGLHSNLNGNSNTRWQEFHEALYGERQCGALYCFATRQYTAPSGINMTDVQGDHTTLQVIQQWSWSRVPPRDIVIEPHNHIVNIWLNWATPTPTVTPTPTPTPTPSPTPTPAITPTPTPIVRVACLDKNNVVIIVAENATQNCNVNTNTQTLSLNVNNSSNNSSTNNNSSNNSSENKSESQSTGGSNTNVITVASAPTSTGTVAGITTSKAVETKTVYVPVVPHVAGIQSVPVTAKTGSQGMAAILLSTLSGGSGLAYVIRKTLIG